MLNLLLNDLYFFSFKVKKEPSSTPKKETVKKEPKKAAKRPKQSVSIH
jgi:hypothetical protein